jgi:hypothetical protein
MSSFCLTCCSLRTYVNQLNNTAIVIARGSGGRINPTERHISPVLLQLTRNMINSDPYISFLQIGASLTWYLRARNLWYVATRSLLYSYSHLYGRSRIPYLVKRLATVWTVRGLYSSRGKSNFPLLSKFQMSLCPTQYSVTGLVREFQTYGVWCWPLTSN